MVTIKDVAARSGVSKATVSRVLNNYPVSPKTYARVMQAIKELNYQPNVQARALSLKRSHIVGLIAPDLQGIFYGPIILGIEEVLRKNGFNLIVSRSQPDSREFSLAKMLKERRVDGLIIATPREIGEKAILALKKDNFPVVLIDGNVGPAINSVEINSYNGAFAACEHLIKLGHKRIGVISGPLKYKEVQDRIKGYRDALEKHGLPFDKKLVKQGDYMFDSGLQQMENLLQLDQFPTAVFAMSDLMAIGAMQSIFRKGLQVPKDIAVVGFDDSEVAKMVLPRLTSVRQPINEMGAVAARKMVAILKGDEKEVTHIKLETTLVIRESCGAGGTKNAKSAVSRIK